VKVALLTAVLAIAAAALPLSAQALQGSYHLNIPRQSLDGALKDLAQQTGLQIARFSDTPGGSALVGPVGGDMSVGQALTSLLVDSGLTYKMVNDRTIAVVAIAAAGSNATAIPSSAASDETPKGGSTKSPFAAFLLAQAGATQPGNVSSGTSQQGQSSGQTVEKSATEKSEVEKLSEVLVTATRRSERVEDVPISIGVLSADDIDQRQLVGEADYLRGMPSVNQTEIAYGGSAIIIRGLETTTSFLNFSGGTTTGTYFGETPTTNSEGLLGSNADIKLVDIDRVEVLKGPQGTAFGSSSMGGTVRIIPNAPKLNTFEGHFEAGYSNTANYGSDNYNFQAVINAPIVEGIFAIRAVAYKFSDSGYYINRAGSDQNYQNSFVIPYGVQAFAIDQKNVGLTNSQGARISALFQPIDALRFTVNYLKQSILTDGYAMANSGTYEQTLLQVAPEYVRRGVTAGAQDTHVEIINPMLEYDLGWANVLGTYSYIRGEPDHAVPAQVFGPSFNWPVAFQENSPHQEHSGELRFVSKFQSAWNFLAGLYYDTQSDTYYSNWVWYGDPAKNFFVPPDRDLFFYQDRRGLTEKAAYAEVSWEFLPRFTLTGGARYYDYNRNGYIHETGPVVGAPVTSNVSNSASGTTGRANLSWKPNPDTLVYGAWSQGFRLGRPQAELPASVCDKDGDGIIDGTNVAINSTTTISSDTVDSYEVGGKFSLADHRVSIDTAVFYMDWKKIPVQIIPPCGFAYTANAGTAKSQGIELQADFQLSKALLLSIGGSYNDAELTSDVPAQGFKSGDPLPAPKEIGNASLQYGYRIAGRPAFVRVDASYVGPFWLDIVKTPEQKAGSYTKVDATARVPAGVMNVDFYVHNLTDQHAYISRQSGGGMLTGYRMQPRTIGFQVEYSF
jgi:outer membrane receptor protein involved in Fe transport